MAEKEKPEKTSVFETLNAINVNEHTEKKNNLTYLSWAWAWAEVKKRYPAANYVVYERDTENGPVNYFTDGKTCWVKTGVTIDGLEHIEELPVMDFKNRSIPLEAVNSMDVNKTIQRSLTKACARHGLGLYIYAGEDLPEEDDDAKASVSELVAEIGSCLAEVGKSMDKEQKNTFAKEVIVPIIGSVNYKTCKDVNKLEMLLEKVKAA